MNGRHARPGPAQRRRESRRITETSDYAAMMIRVLYGYGARIGDDPAALAHLRGIEAALRDAVNVGIFTANTAGTRPYSLGEIAAILGITRQGIHKRARLGEEVFIRLEAARANGAVVRLADVRAARAAVLAEAGVTDRTGSQRERQAGLADGRTA
jgi:hypothetical protein